MLGLWALGSMPVALNLHIAFDAELKRKWSIYHHETSSGGLPILASYWRSPLSDNLANGFAEHLGFIVKCLIAAPLRWRRALRKRFKAGRTEVLRDRV